MKPPSKVELERKQGSFRLSAEGLPALLIACTVCILMLAYAISWFVTAHASGG